MKGVICTCLSLVYFGFAYSQSIAVNTDGSAPNASAILDIKSTTRGLLIPWLTLVQRNAVATPATGLLIYQTDNTAGYYYNGAAWLILGVSGGGTNYSGHRMDSVFIPIQRGMWV